MKANLFLHSLVLTSFISVWWYLQTCPIQTTSQKHTNPESALDHILLLSVDLRGLWCLCQITRVGSPVIDVPSRHGHSYLPQLREDKTFGTGQN